MSDWETCVTWCASILPSVLGIPLRSKLPPLLNLSRPRVAWNSLHVQAFPELRRKTWDGRRVGAAKIEGEIGPPLEQLRCWTYLNSFPWDGTSKGVHLFLLGRYNKWHFHTSLRKCDLMHGFQRYAKAPWVALLHGCLDVVNKGAGCCALKHECGNVWAFLWVLIY